MHSYPNPDLIKKNLTHPSLCSKIICVQETPSTNSLAKKIAREGCPHGTLVICANQTAGRGRGGRQWQSNEHTGLCMSIILKPTAKTEDMMRYTPAFALSVAKALQKFGVDCEIKWPNDILVQGKKICGILSEAIFSGSRCEYLICGIGVNVNDVFSPSDDKYITQYDPAQAKDVETFACSVFSVTGRITEREALAAAIINEIQSVFHKCETESDFKCVLEEYSALSCIINREVRVFTDNPFTGIAVGLDTFGRLLVQTSRGTVCLNEGDVSLRLV
ncbi:MAG: biotin--[Clostridia bacterium]|nr:biotin--[acetyl-CoA-carboxylase] ligase [Clostridia bacterium]